MEGRIIGRSRHRDALMFRNWKGVFLCAGYSFVPSFPVIVQRYWFENDYVARELIRTLNDPELRELLSLAETVGPTVLPENVGSALRERVFQQLMDDRIRVYHFTELHYIALGQAQQTLLTDMRTVRSHDIVNNAQANPQELREAITFELSRSLIERGLTKTSWDRTLRDEGFFWGGVIRAGAAVAGAMDFAKGLADTASLVVDLSKQSAAGVYAVARFHFEINQAVLTGNFGKAQQIIRELGGKVNSTIEDAKRYFEEGRRALEVLFADPVIGVMLVQYGSAYISATPQTEKIRGAFTLGGDVLLSLGIAVVTGGAGAGVAAANLARSFGMFSGRLVQLMARLYRAMAKAAAQAKAAAEEARLIEKALRREQGALELPSGTHKAPEPELIVQTPRMARFEPPCFQPGSKIPADKYPEYDRQLKGQEAGLNDMSVDEYLEGRDRYKTLNRLGQYEQARARLNYEADLRNRFAKELENEGIFGAEAAEQASSMAKERMKTLAALHNPDQVMGGGAAISGFGDSQVNSSIGSHWKSRVDAIDEVAKSIPRELRQTLKMHIKIERCK